jgi:hypothetical protein
MECGRIHWQNKVNERDEFREKERRKYCEKEMTCQKSKFEAQN